MTSASVMGHRQNLDRVETVQHQGSLEGIEINRHAAPLPRARNEGEAISVDGGFVMR
jgi:hypothetical protein